MSKPHIRYLDTGPWPCFIGIALDEPSFAKEMKRLGVPEVQFLGHSRANATAHTLINDGALCCILAIQPWKTGRSREQYAALVAHEAVHIVQAMQDELAGGKRLGDEAEAYLVQMIVQEVLQDAWKSRLSRRVVPVGSREEK